MDSESWSEAMSTTMPDPEGDSIIFQGKMDIAFMVIYSLAFVLGAFGNGLVIFITGFRMKKTVNTVWFFNLAIADFTFIFSLFFVRASVVFQWYMNLAMCKIHGMLTSLNLYTSVYLLMVISIDRCISVRHPVWAQNHRTPRMASFVALGVWILALILSSPTGYFIETIANSADKKHMKCYNNYSEFQMISGPAVAISRFTFAFLIPFTVILVCYGAIVLRLRSSQLSQSNKPYKVITAVVVPFFVGWFPYYVFVFIDMKYAPHSEKMVVLAIGFRLASCLGFINSCLNPIFYVFMGESYRETLKRSLVSAFENAFTEDVRQITTNKTKFSAEPESQL